MNIVNDLSPANVTEPKRDTYLEQRILRNLENEAQEIYLDELSFILVVLAELRTGAEVDLSKRGSNSGCCGLDWSILVIASSLVIVK